VAGVPGPGDVGLTGRLLEDDFLGAAFLAGAFLGVDLRGDTGREEEDFLVGIGNVLVICSHKLLHYRRSYSRKNTYFYDRYAPLS